jgi:RecA-family ATPase
LGGSAEGRGVNPDLQPRATADDAWVRARQSSAPATDQPRRNGQAKSAQLLDFTTASSLAGREPPERPWIVPGWIPRRQVTLLTGDGGTGKSLLSMQLMVAAATGTRWFSLPTFDCHCLGVFAEDDDDELARRLIGIAKASGVVLGGLDRMAYRSAVVDACELVTVDDVGQVCPTDYFLRLQETVRSLGSQVVILDAATNPYGGDEIRRRQVNGFVMLLRRLAMEIDGAVLLLAHPSAQGLSTGSGLSGSTHWHNAVRSRLYFARTTGDDADPDERTLTRLKANYAGVGDVIRVRWSDGAFIELDMPSGVDRVAINAKADRVFLALLARTYGEGTWLCPNPSARNFAPTIFAKHPDREGLGRPAFDGAMHRLLKDDQIKTETYGRSSEPRTRLAPG